MDLKGKIDDAMSGFESLVKKIPGYAGYKEKEQRREADALLRDHLAREFEAQWNRMNDLRSQMLMGEAMSQLDEMGRASRRLQTLIDKIKVAAQGYAGFFDAIKVEEEALDALYDFDQKMLGGVDTVAEAVDGVQAALDSEEGIPAAVRNLTRTIDELTAQFEKRKDVITGLA
jgi:hypothetical protein